VIVGSFAVLNAGETGSPNREHQVQDSGIFFTLSKKGLNLKKKGGENMKRTRGLLLLSIISIVWVHSVNAAFIDYSASMSGLTPVEDYKLSVNQFDSTLGTLFGATFTLHGTVASSLTVTPTTGDSSVTWSKQNGYEQFPEWFGPNDRYYVELYGPFSMAVADAFSGSVLNNQPVPLSGGPVTFSAPTLDGMATFAFTTDLSSFIGNGTIEFFLGANSFDALSVTSNASANLSTNYSGEVSVVYDYHPVPVPAAVWLLGSGLIGMLGLRKKFNS
jgi:hypothetical protein